jgi:hypothetical protein
MACIAIAIAALEAGIERFGSTNTTIEVISYHPSGKTAGSVEFLVHLPNGFLQSAVPVPPHASSVDYSQLVGSKYAMRYRERRILWLAPENPAIVAFDLIQAAVDRFGGKKPAN